ncbi:MAG: membrane dipeptidase [Acidobacteriota bacterium]|nr:membrane dipeptidase [Acidobacteriota bacterium]
MKSRIVVTLILGVSVCLMLSTAPDFVVPFSTIVQLAHAQGSEDMRFWVFDGHMHPISSATNRGGDIGDGLDPQFSLALAEQGGLGAGFFNTSVDDFYGPNHLAVKEVIRQFDHLYRQIAMYPNQIGMATSGEELRELRRQNKIAAILAIEGAMAIEQDLGVLRMLHRLGLREMNLVHNLANEIGDVMYTTGKGSGLTAYGYELVAEMNRLGIIIDLSHTAEQTIMDVIAASTQPVTTTHSGARTLVDRPGKWSDEMIRALAAKGGVICAAFLPQQVSQEYDRKWHGGRQRGSGIMGLEPLIYRGDPTQIYDFITERRNRGGSGRSRMDNERLQDIPPLSNLIDTIDHIVRLVGPDHVGISSDWGGYPVNIKGIENAGEYQSIGHALLQRGYTRIDVEKIMGDNLMRLFDQVVSTTTM